MRAYERFLKYVVVDTQSDGESTTFPSTLKQLDLAKALEKEMTDMGISDSKMDEYGYVYGKIPASKGCENLPVLALLAHMDTAPALSGTDVKPSVIHYEGGDIVLNEDLGYVTRAKDFPHMVDYIGEDLIITDGTTLLGADDKAGIAEILTMAEVLLADPTIPHPPISICFTPDEEVGGGVDHVNLEEVGASYGYTIDGSRMGELEYENFNAATAIINVEGSTAHTGSAKGVMLNAVHVAMEFHQMLPTFQNPAFTEGREGFFHLENISGKTECAKMMYLIRDHSKELFEEKQQVMKTIETYLNNKYGAGTVKVEIKESYLNMYEQVLPHMHLVDNAIEAMKQAGIEPFVAPIRGGTDGARLSYMGLPCPNLCTGSQNLHGRHECISIQAMDKVVEILLNLVKIYAN